MITRGKYNNIKTMIDGIFFDSKGEGMRYGILKLLEKAGEIKDLELQPSFVLLEPFTYQGKRYRAIKYKADFRYVEGNKTIVEDFKGYKNNVYLLKKKMLLSKYPTINFIETSYEEV